MLVTCAEMQRLESDAFARGVEAAALMEYAGLAIAEIVRQFHPRPGVCLAFCGKGNNAGDALVALRHLHGWGWEIQAELAYDAREFSELSKVHYESIREKLSPTLEAPRVLLDGLLGIGAKGDPRVEIATAIERMNALRRRVNAWTLAIDIPSGLDGDTGRAAPYCVEADLTATIALPKCGLVADAAVDKVGRLALVPLPDLAGDITGITSPAVLRSWLPGRAFDMHKGQAGRVGIVAGSVGLTGAARLASAAAVHAGAGLVTLYAKPDVQPVLAAACIPEVMVKPVKTLREILDEPMDVFAVGPGLGREQGAEILPLIRDARQPVVVDADALNAVAHDPAILKHCRGPRVLTPHPGEMERLFPRGDRSRAEWLGAFLEKHPVTLLLKGSRTIIGDSGGRRIYNTTGHPGMASGGMGDVLSGTIAALIKQCGGEVFHAAALGAWLCGRAAESAVYSENGSGEFLSASQVIEHLGAAFRSLRQGY